jgi:hypothetical protein
MLGDKIKELRKSKNMYQQDLADALIETESHIHAEHTCSHHAAHAEAAKAAPTATEKQDEKKPQSIVTEYSTATIAIR